MKTLNLILKFKLIGNAQLHVKGAARIKVDGRGNLLLSDPDSGATERIALRELESLEIHTLLDFGSRQLLAVS